MALNVMPIYVGGGKKKKPAAPTASGRGTMKKADETTKPSARGFVAVKPAAKAAPASKPRAEVPGTGKTPVEIVKNPYYKETDKFSSPGSYKTSGGSAPAAKAPIPKARPAQAGLSRNAYEGKAAAPAPKAKPLREVVAAKKTAPKAAPKPKVVMKKSPTGKGMAVKTKSGNWVGAASSKRKGNAIQRRRVERYGIDA